MSFFSRIREWFSRMFTPQKISNTFGIKVNAGASINDAITEWQSIYQGRPAWVGEGTEQIPYSLNVASTIVNDIATKSVAELNLSADTQDQLLKDWFSDEVQLQIRHELEHGLVGGAFIIRPYYSAELNRIALSWYTADRFIPVDFAGRRCVSGVFVDQDCEQNGSMFTYWTKLELQKWVYGKDGLGGSVEITVKLFKSSSPNDISNEVPLTSYEKWATIQPSAKIDNLTSPLFVYVPMPFANNIDLNSKQGVSIYKDGVALLERIDRTWDNLNWELDSSANKVFVDESMLPQERDSSGHLHTKIDSKDKKLYKMLDANGSASKMIDIYSPAIRQADITATLKTNLSLLCSACHLDSGAYVYDEASNSVTATEIKSKQQKTYVTICDIQKWSITPAIEQVFEATKQLQMLYNLPTFTADEITVDYGDSILIDEQTDKQNAQSECNYGLRSKLSYLMQYRGLSEEDARQELDRIAEETPKQTDFFGGGFNA